LNSSHIGRIFKKYALIAKVEFKVIKNISSHSMRVGAAQDLLREGKSFPEIIKKGRWTKIETAIKYIEFA